VRNRFWHSTTVAVGLAAAIGSLSLALESAGQAPQETSAAFVPGRTADGQPDFQGMWLPAGMGFPMETASGGPQAPAAAAAPDDYADPNPGEAAGGRGGRGAGGRGGGGRGGRGGGGQKPTMVVDPADGKIPFQPWALARREEIMANQHSFAFIDPRIRCLPAGVPRVNLPIQFNTYQILQTPGHVTFLYEWNHLYRDIPLDGRPHVDPKVRLWMGDSRGRWEGNTLVVDVTNFTDKTHLLGHNQAPEGAPASSITGGQGVFHSEALHVVERYTMVDASTIRYEATIEDPKVFTRPFKIAWNAFQRAPKDHQLYEYACFEGDSDMVQRMTGVDIDPSLNVEH
jgi:hypothetical protein